ncbi:MAG: hypothetical protein RR367_03640 [Clostridia bacterium]
MEQKEACPGTRNRRACWLPAMGLVTLLYLCLLLFGADIRFGGNDDSGIMRAFLGYETGEIPTFHIFLHAVLVYPLRWLSLAFPLVPWFSVLQIALLWLSCTVAVKSVLQCFCGHPRWAGLLASVLFLIAFAMAYCCQITFTVTAALLGTAAVMQILSIDYAAASDGAVVRGMALALLLVVLAYALRQITALPILAFCALAFLLLWTLRFHAGRRGAKPFLWSLAMVLLVMGGLMAQREWDIDRNQMREHLAWQDATANVIDYVGTKGVSPETFEALGWSEAERQMVDLWYMLDENITVEAFGRIYAERLSQLDQSFAGRARFTINTLAEFVRTEKLAMRTVWLLLAAAAICFIGLGGHPKNKRWLGLCIGASLLLSLLLLCYLGSKGRMPLRAALMVLLPMAGMLVCLLPACLTPKAKGLRLAARAAGLCLCAALALWYAVPQAKALAPMAYEPGEEINVYADLFEYALDNPDKLIIYDLTLSGDTRLFPDLSHGVPHNLLFWGGWTARSPAVLQQMEAFGIDGSHFTAADFLRENVCFASGVLDPGPETLLAYLRAELGDEIDYMNDSDWGGVHTFTFYSLAE